LGGDRASSPIDVVEYDDDEVDDPEDDDGEDDDVDVDEEDCVSDDEEDEFSTFDDASELSRDSRIETVLETSGFASGISELTIGCELARIDAKRGDMSRGIWTSD
jgi:hypothetical protein